jgi:dolichol-phosphate mannosyltransferase
MPDLRAHGDSGKPHDPSAYPPDVLAQDAIALVEALGRHASPSRVIICGHRQRRQDTWVRRLSSRVANSVRSRALGDATPDTGCGLKAFERSLFLQLPRFNHMHRFLPALVRRSGGEAVSVPVNHRPRLHGQSKYGIGNRLWVGIVDIFGVMWLRRRFKPGLTVRED